jgi:hypothetical protein
VVTREQMIEQSIQDYVRDMLFNKFNYPQDEVELLDAFPARRFDKALDHTYVALGFNFDDGGRGGEMGSDLKRRIYTVELFVFGHTSLWGRNVGNAVKAALEQDATIPLKDISDPAQPVIDFLTIPPGGLRVQHVHVRDPRPWEENVWLCRVNLEDYYFAALV